MWNFFLLQSEKPPRWELRRRARANTNTNTITSTKAKAKASTNASNNDIEDYSNNNDDGTKHTPRTMDEHLYL